MPNSIPNVKQHIHLYAEISKLVLLTDAYHIITENIFPALAMRLLNYSYQQ